jgi:hypothetical protein
MPTQSEMIAQIKAQTLERIAEITAQPKPTYALADGHRVSWTEYLKQLLATVEWCDRQMDAAAPLEIQSQGYT